MGTGVEARREGGCMGGTVMRCRPRTCTHLQYLPCSVRSPPQVPAPGVRRAQRTALHAIGTRMAGPTEREMPRARAPPGSQRQRRDHNDNVDCGDVIMTAPPPNSKPPQLTKTLKNLGTDHSPLKTHTAVTLLGKRVPPPGPPPARRCTYVDRICPDVSIRVHTHGTTTQPRHTAIPTRVFATANENYALLQSSATAFRPNAPRSVPLPLVAVLGLCDRTFALLGCSGAVRCEPSHCPGQSWGQCENRGRKCDFRENGCCAKNS